MRTVPQQSSAARAAAIAWVVAAVFYFYQYTVRSAPAVMMPQLADAFGVSALGLASVVGLFYYGYSPFSLVAGAAIDQFGTRKVLPISAVVMGIGAALFAVDDAQVASVGRFLQGAGGVFAAVGALYIAASSFPPSQAATLIGATQMFGMAGGSAGQFAVGPMIAAGLPWNRFWMAMGIVGFLMAAVLLALLPRRSAQREGGQTGNQ